jgi:hypothetical protein
LLGSGLAGLWTYLRKRRARRLAHLEDEELLHEEMGETA